MSVWDLIGQGNVDGIRRIAEQEDVSALRSVRGMTPLILAVKSGHATVVEFLLSRGCKPNETTDLSSPVSGKVDRLVTALMFARTIDVFDVLVRHGADVLMRDGNDRSCLYRIGLSMDPALFGHALSIAGGVEEDERHALLDLARDELAFRTKAGQLVADARLVDLAGFIKLLESDSERADELAQNRTG